MQEKIERLIVEQFSPPATLITGIYQFRHERAGKIYNGTCFSILYREEEYPNQYLITCSHFFSGYLESGSEVEFSIFLKDKWQKINKKIYFPKNREIDLAVIDLNDIINLPTAKYHLGSNGIMMGQPINFLGFPLKHYTEYVKGFRQPFFKNGIYSGEIDEKGSRIIYIDAMNCEGFSGSPAIYKNVLKNTYSILGVISGYLADEFKLKTHLGDYPIPVNSGMTKCFPIEGACKIIDEEIFKNINNPPQEKNPRKNPILLEDWYERKYHG